MNIGFHSNQLSYRGTEIALFDYADYNQKLLNNTSYIFYPYGSDTSALEKFRNNFGQNVICYASLNELQQLCKQYNIELVYWIKYGTNDGKIIPGAKNLVHSVFNVKEPHGDVYAYVSEWLGIQNNMDYVPHIVSLPDIKENYREYLNIPDDALVFGRFGGNDTFDIEYVHSCVRQIASENSNIYFLFMNTNVFCESLPNIMYFGATDDVELKTSFINTCDAMLHARNDGESFGLSVCEFLHQDKPVITNIQCRDKNHIKILGDKGYYYKNNLELEAIIRNFVKKDYKYSELVKEFSPEKVMAKFKKVFIDEK